LFSICFVERGLSFGFYVLRRLISTAAQGSWHC
jgi:hypothetical protein